MQGWALALAAVLACSSLVPVLAGLAWGLCGPRPATPPHSSKIYRVDTSASTAPMLQQDLELEGRLGGDDSESETGSEDRASEESEEQAGAGQFRL